MKRRTAFFFFLFMIVMFWTILQVYDVSTGEQLAEAAAAQSTYEVEIAETRGTIYDCHLTPLVGNSKEYIASVSPSVEAANAVSKILNQTEMANFYTLLTQGKPFAWVLPKAVEAEGMDVFEIDIRYETNQLAPNVIGYLDGSGNGVSGIEKAYNSYLSDDPGRIAVRYKVDAVNRVLRGESYEIENTYYKKNSGVVLTLDAAIQKKTEELAPKYLKKGAVIVLEVETGKIRAMVSQPSFCPTDLESALEDPDSPFLNRCLESYNVGSVFKLVSAAAALQSGISEEEEFDCQGVLDVSGTLFHCFDGISHGSVNMQEAVAQSCNVYFIDLMQKVTPKEFLEMAGAFGFGKSQELAPGIFSKAGNLPTEEELQNLQTLANFSFGQGSLLATPLQIAAMVRCIANDGMYSEPVLVEGLVDSAKQWVEQTPNQEEVRVISQETAKKLKEFMAASVDHGTGRGGRPLIGMAGAKTGTAQTGVLEGDREVIQAWYAGFYPLTEPKYAIVVLGEDEEKGGSICAPVFQELCNWLALEF